MLEFKTRRVNQTEFRIDAEAEYQLTECLPGVTLLTVYGSVAGQTVATFCDALAVAEDRSRRGLIVSMEFATYACAQSYCILAGVARRFFNDADRPFIIVAPESPPIADTLQLMPLKNVVKTLSAALLLIRAESTSTRSLPRPAFVTSAFFTKVGG